MRVWGITLKVGTHTTLLDVRSVGQNPYEALMILAKSEPKLMPFLGMKLRVRPANRRGWGWRRVKHTAMFGHYRLTIT